LGSIQTKEAMRRTIPPAVVPDEPAVQALREARLADRSLEDAYMMSKE